MSGQQQQNKRNSSLMNKETEEIFEENDENQEDADGKKSSDNGLNGAVDDNGGSSSSSASNTSNILRPSPTAGRKTPSPSASPHSSPKLGVKNEAAHHVKSPSQTSLSINAEKSDNAEDSVSKSSDSSSQQNSSDFTKSACQIDGDKPKVASKISERAKKKSWYNVLYPSYKSRSEDFKKLFKGVPDDERLVVDYSCALQKDILVHGRLYVSQNYLCFYANIFRWETCLCIKWKDVESITKEKTARVIPNAILVSTKTEKHFITSFTTRDKAFLMLFRVWQNALMDKQMQPQEMWQWVHNCYGDELGLTSDDEDYIDPYLNKDDELVQAGLVSDSKNKSAGSSEEQNSTDNKLSSSGNMNSPGDGSKRELSPKKSTEEILKERNLESKRKSSKNPRNKDDNIIKTAESLPTDSSNSSDSDEEKSIPFISTAECTSMHEGRQFVHTILPINVDTLFNLLFSKSKFLVDFHTARRSTNMVHGNWTIGEDGIKTRIVNVTVALLAHVGPKTSNVTETQVIRECSQPGQLYSIDVNSVNAGIPYADSFSVLMHYCLVKTVDDHTMLSVHCQIKYKKSIWGVVKGFIEKNAWAGLEDFYTALLRALQSEYCIPPAKGKGRRPRRGGTLTRTVEEVTAVPALQPDIAKHNLPSPDATFAESSTKYKLISWFVIVLLAALIFLNVILLYKLRNLESKGFSDDTIAQFPDFSALKDLPKNHEDWIELLKQQEALHETEMRKWQAVLQTAIELLKKVSVVCEKIVQHEPNDEKLNAILKEL